ncbi:MAG: 50S ribosomal protein L10 [Myxococcota bacterium]|nr:50S ribosomal protein L10 [Myxococcota bacterium]
MSRAEKQEIVTELSETLRASAGTIFVDYAGIDVNTINDIRSQFRAAGVRYQVVKNSLMSRALELAELDSDAASLKGSPTAVIFCNDDPVNAAKLTADLSKKHKKLKVKGGILESEIISAEQAVALSKMPNREELLSQIIGQALSPGRKIASQIKSPSGKVLGAIDKFIENLEG